MTKNQLRQRLEDVAAGIGMVYIDDGFWEFQEFDTFKSLALYLNGLIVAFDLPEKSMLLSLHNSGEYESLDSLVEFWWRNKPEWQR